MLLFSIIAEAISPAAMTRMHKLKAKRMTIGEADIGVCLRGWLVCFALPGVFLLGGVEIG